MSNNELATFEFDLSIYRIEAIKKAAYRYSGQFDVQLRSVNEHQVCVTLGAKSEVNAESLDASLFPNEVLDQELRESVGEETEGVRNLLLAQAFSSFTIVDPDSEAAEFGEDPLDIGLNPSAGASCSRPSTDSASTEVHRDP